MINIGLMNAKTIQEISIMHHTISYPYFFEILAIPFDDPRSADRNLVFIGAVNYSISPKKGG